MNIAEMYGLFLDKIFVIKTMALQMLSSQCNKNIIKISTQPSLKNTDDLEEFFKKINNLSKKYGEECHSCDYPIPTMR